MLHVMSDAVFRSYRSTCHATVPISHSETQIRKLIPSFLFFMLLSDDSEVFFAIEAI
ncbi:hypothetical protein ROS217_02590 [Roseovarius sp. 217]|nr:hypothetical protein ROS217_02590 [Roseovarius sp. 217]